MVYMAGLCFTHLNLLMEGFEDHWSIWNSQWWSVIDQSYLGKQQWFVDSLEQENQKANSKFSVKSTEREKEEVDLRDII